MMADWSALTQAICAVLALATTVIGFWFISVQIRLIEQQMRGATHGTLYDHFSKIGERLSNAESLRKYFSDDESCALTHADYKKVQLIAEMFADFFEHVALQIENLPSESVDCWEKACFLRYSNSPAIREHLERYKYVYAPAIFRMLERGKQRMAKVKIT